jgi:hypothetical protein
VTIRPSRTFLPLVFFLAIRIAIADDPIVQRVILVPSELGEVRFGDPIYVPIAIVNRSHLLKSFPLLSRGTPALRCSYSTTGEPWKGRCLFSKNEGIAGRYDRHELPAKSSDSTVLCVDVWHPKIAKSLLETRTVSIEFHELDNVGNPVNGLSARTKLIISGSAFRDDSDMLENAVKSLEVRMKPTTSTSDANRIETCALPLYLDTGEGFNIYEFGAYSWLNFDPFDPSSEKPLTNEEAVDPLNNKVSKGSALFRLVRARELMKQIGDSQGDMIRPLIDRYRDNLRYASHPEFQFLVRLLFHHERIGAETRDTLTREFPNVVGAANPHAGQPYTSSLSILGPE